MLAPSTLTAFVVEPKFVDGCVFYCYIQKCRILCVPRDIFCRRIAKRSRYEDDEDWAETAPVTGSSEHVGRAGKG